MQLVCLDSYCEWNHQLTRDRSRNWAKGGRKHYTLTCFFPQFLLTCFNLYKTYLYSSH